MKLRLLAIAVLMAGLLVSVGGTAAEKSKADIEKTKVALQALGELGFVGQWKLSGDATLDGKKVVVNELWEWGWKFDKKTGEGTMIIAVKDGKFFTSGDLSYDVTKKIYTFAAKDAANKDLNFTGKLVRDKFVLERKDDKTGDIYRFSLNTLSEGIRFSGVIELQAGGKGLPSTICKLSGGKEGESFAGGKKKNECCVTGGAGTIPVSYMGKTYYVCCSGCKDAFDSNPKKVVEDYEKSKKK
jgi:hypothetical protein